MGLSREEVFRVARLAQINLTEAEAASLPAQLDRIVDYVQSLESVATEGVREALEAAASPLRADETAPSLPHGEVMRIAPAQRDGLIVVPRVIGADEAGS
jgi:aspartyl-tRNA(Asn)/glutamyl-tRNA(Gln) amidotransferase subunit C